MLAAESFAPFQSGGLFSIGFLVNAWIKASVLLSVAGLLTVFLKRSSASARHAVWGIGLLASLGLPLLSLLLSPLNIPLLPAGLGSPPAQAKQSLASGKLPETLQVPGLVESVGETVPRAADARRAAIPTASGHDPVSGIQSPANPAIVQRSNAIWDRLTLVLAMFWLSGFLVSLSRWLAGVLGAGMIVSRSQPVANADSIKDFTNLSDSLALRRAVRFLEYDGGSMPMTCGILRPAIVLPTLHRGWPSERRKIVLLHELSHVKRWDCLAHAIAQIACAFYWLNPLVWFAARRLRVESENACDDVVIGSGTRASDYAGHLLEIARAFGISNASPRGALTIARRSELESRLRSILTPDRQDRAGGERLRRALVSVGLLSLAVILAAIAPCPRKAAADGRATAGATNRISSDGPTQDLLPGYTESAGTTLHNTEPEQAEASPDRGMPGEPSGSPADGFAASARDSEEKSINQVLQDAVAGLPEAGARHEISADSGTNSAQAGSATSQDGPTSSQQAKIDAGVEALVGALKDDNHQVRAQAAWALGLNGDDRSVEPLILALKDQSAYVRSQAAWALGLRGDRRAIEPLTSALKDPQAQVRSQAAWALGLKGDERAVEPLVSALTDPESQVRSQAAWALGLKGNDRAVEPLGSALKDESSHVRSQAAWALGLKGNSRSVEPLISALKDHSTQVRSQAAWALGLKGDNRCVEPLMSALNDESPHVRSQAAWALGLKGDARAVDGLKALLNDSANEVRRQAQWALGMLLMRSGGEGGDEREDEADGDDGNVGRAHRHQHLNSRPHPYGRVRPNSTPSITVDPVVKHTN